LDKGVFITFEGADGSGKSTQMNLLKNYFDKHNVNYIFTRDPGGTELGALLRNILLNYEGNIFPTCELFLYLADRAQHVDEKIIPALKEGKIVLCDRYIDSTAAYQGYARGLDINQIKLLNDIATHFLCPDVTFLFDIDTDVAMKRLGGNRDRLESETKEFHQKVRQGYLEIAANNPDRIKVIDANRTVEQIFQELLTEISKFVEFKRV